MFAVGVDVSHGRSTVAVLGAKRKVVMKPFEVPHTVDGFASLAEKLNGLDGEVRIVMEHTGRYYESFAMSMYRAGFLRVCRESSGHQGLPGGHQRPQSQDRQGRRSENCSVCH